MEHTVPITRIRSSARAGTGATFHDVLSTRPRDSRHQNFDACDD